MRVADIRELTKEDVLGKLGLTTVPSRSRRLFGRAGTFGFGLLAGMSVMLLFPKAVPKLRQRFNHHFGRHWRRLRDDGGEFVASAASRVLKAL